MYLSFLVRVETSQKFQSDPLRLHIVDDVHNILFLHGLLVDYLEVHELYVTVGLKDLKVHIRGQTTIHLMYN